MRETFDALVGIRRIRGIAKAGTDRYNWVPGTGLFDRKLRGRTDGK
jgi:hypothetical protein